MANTNKDKAMCSHTTQTMKHLTGTGHTLSCGSQFCLLIGFSFVDLCHVTRIVYSPHVAIVSCRVLSL